MGRQRKLAETTGASGRVAPKRPARLPVSPVTGAEEIGPVRTDGSGPVRADGFADEDVVQEAEELRHVPAPVLPSEAEVDAHHVSHLPFRTWCSAFVRGRGLSLCHRSVDAKTEEAEQIPTISVDCGFFGTEHMTRSRCSLCVIAKAKAFGVMWCRRCTRIQQGL